MIPLFGYVVIKKKDFDAEINRAIIKGTELGEENALLKKVTANELRKFMGLDPIEKEVKPID